MAKFPDIKIGVSIGVQQYYDDLVLMRKSIDTQIKVLGNDSSICTHIKTVELADGVVVCANRFCNKVMDKGIHDWVK